MHKQEAVNDALGQILALVSLMFLVWLGVFAPGPAILLSLTIIPVILLSAGMSELHKYAKPEKKEANG